MTLAAQTQSSTLQAAPTTHLHIVRIRAGYRIDEMCSWYKLEHRICDALLTVMKCCHVTSEAQSGFILDPSSHKASLSTTYSIVQYLFGAHSALAHIISYLVVAPRGYKSK